MAFKFKKNIVVGVSVNPDLGLEIAQIDVAQKTVLKYSCRQLSYDNLRREIADMDIFKETLQDMLFEMDIPKGSEIVVNIPATTFKIVDYPTSLNFEQVVAVIEEDLMETSFFQNTEPDVSVIKLPNSTIQTSKYALSASQKVMIIEMAMQIKELGYSLIAVDTSVNSTLNALIYNEMISDDPDASWVLLLVESNCCRVIPMQGQNYVDCFEELISIGQVLGDEENYSTVVNAVQPILRNVPSSRLHIVSKTDIISAKELANKLEYNAQIIHQEVNYYNSSPLMEVAEDIDKGLVKTITTDVIGAAIYRDYSLQNKPQMNLFNNSLGDVYLQEQPPILTLNGKKYVLSLENMITASITFAVAMALVVVGILILLNNQIKTNENKIKKLESSIAQVEKFLTENKNISTELFDEGDEIRIGLVHNKGIYTYYTIVGTEIPKKLWLTSLKLGSNTVIEGQADNLESIYGFFRSIKDYNPESPIKLQKLGLASSSALKDLTSNEKFDTESILTSMNADFYQFTISDVAEQPKEEKEEKAEQTTKTKNKKLPGRLR